MPEWLHDFFPKEGHLRLSVVVVQLSVALALGCVVAAIYRATRGKGSSASAGMTATLALLTLLLAVVTMVIGDNTARAFSLVGALGIVRFRTVVEDTRDTAFVILAVAVGMALGAGYLMVPLVVLPIAALGAFLYRPRGASSLPRSLAFTVHVRLGAGHTPDSLLREPFDRHLEAHRLIASATARQGAALDLTYLVQMRREDAILGLVSDLTALEGVQSVELRQA
jgi:hypothetical protein